MSNETVEQKLPFCLFSGKTAIVTGASRGIGRATALRFAQAGANVVVNYYQHEAEALQVVAECRNYGVKAIAVQADVSKPEEAERLNEAALREFGGLDIVVANAGIWEGDASKDYATSMALIILQMPNRYLPVYTGKGPGS